MARAAGALRDGGPPVVSAGSRAAHDSQRAQGDCVVRAHADFRTLGLRSLCLRRRPRCVLRRRAAWHAAVLFGPQRLLALSFRPELLRADGPPRQAAATRAVREQWLRGAGRRRTVGGNEAAT